MNKKTKIILSAFAVGAVIIPPAVLAASCSTTNNKTNKNVKLDFVNTFGCSLDELKTFSQQNPATFESLVASKLNVSEQEIKDIQFNAQGLVVKTESALGSCTYTCTFTPIFNPNPSQSNSIVPNTIANQTSEYWGMDFSNFTHCQKVFGQTLYPLVQPTPTVPNPVQRTIPISIQEADKEIETTPTASYLSDIENLKFDLASYFVNHLNTQFDQNKLDIVSTNLFFNLDLKLENSKPVGSWIVQFKNPSKQMITFDIFGHKFDIQPNQYLSYKLTIAPTTNFEFCALSGLNQIGINLINPNVEYSIGNTAVQTLTDPIKFVTHFDVYNLAPAGTKVITNTKGIAQNPALVANNVSQLNSVLSDTEAVNLETVKKNITNWATGQFTAFKSIALGAIGIMQKVANPDLSLFGLLTTLGYTYAKDDKSTSPTDETYVLEKGPLSKIISHVGLDQNIQIVLNNLLSNQPISNFLYHSFDALMNVIDMIKTPANDAIISTIQDFLSVNLKNKPLSEYQRFIKNLSSLKYTIKIFLESSLHLNPIQLDYIYSLVDSLANDQNIFAFLGSHLNANEFKLINGLVQVPAINNILSKLIVATTELQDAWTKDPSLQTETDPSKQNVLTMKFWDFILSNKVRELLASIPAINWITFPQFNEPLPGDTNPPTPAQLKAKIISCLNSILYTPFAPNQQGTGSLKFFRTIYGKPVADITTAMYDKAAKLVSTGLQDVKPVQGYDNVIRQKMKPLVPQIATALGLPTNGLLPDPLDIPPYVDLPGHPATVPQNGQSCVMVMPPQDPSNLWSDIKVCVEYYYTGLDVLLPSIKDTSSGLDQKITFAQDYEHKLQVVRVEFSPFAVPPAPAPSPAPATYEKKPSTNFEPFPPMYGIDSLYKFVDMFMQFDPNKDIVWPKDDVLFNPVTKQIDISTLKYGFKFENPFESDPRLKPVKVEIPTKDLIWLLPKIGPTPPAFIPVPPDTINGIIDGLKTAAPIITVYNQIQVSGVANPTEPSILFASTPNGVTWSPNLKASIGLASFLKVGIIQPPIKIPFNLICKNQTSLKPMEFSYANKDTYVVMPTQETLNQFKTIIDDTVSTKEQKVEQIKQLLLVNKTNLDLSQLVRVDFSKTKPLIGKPSYNVSLSSMVPLYFETLDASGTIVSNGTQTSFSFTIS